MALSDRTADHPVFRNGRFSRQVAMSAKSRHQIFWLGCGECNPGFDSFTGASRCENFADRLKRSGRKSATTDSWIEGGFHVAAQLAQRLERLGMAAQLFDRRIEQHDFLLLARAQAFDHVIELVEEVD